MMAWVRTSLAANGRNGLFVLALVGVAVVGFCWGRHSSPMGPGDQGTDYPQEQTGSGHAKTPSPIDPNARVVAFVHEKEPIYREEFGDFLITRFGPERLDFFIKRRLLDAECQAKNIHVTDAEIDAELKLHLKTLGQNITERDFEQVLKPKKVTLFEWKEDVIRVKLQLRKLVEPTITVSEAEVRQAFEMKFGPSVECRMIALQIGDEHRFRIHERVRMSEAEFHDFARKQFVPTLAATGGKIPPIHRHFPDADVEKEAFSLKEGDVSTIIDVKDTHLILKCDKHHKAQDRDFDKERQALASELHDVKLGSRIPEYFQEMWRKAKPEVLLKKMDSRTNTAKISSTK